MGKKNHAKIFIIADKDLYKNIPVEEEMEFTLAMNSVRARCFTSLRLANVCDNEKTLDWEMKTALTLAMIKACDVVAVIGSTVTPDMINEIKLAADANKKICVTKALQSIILEHQLPVFAKELITVCKTALSENGK